MTTPVLAATPEQVALEHAAQTGAIRAAALAAAAQAWAEAPVDLAELLTWWFGEGRDRIFTAVSLGQEMSAGLARDYVTDSMAVQGYEIATPRIDPSRFAATASDGRDLGSLLDQVPFSVYRRSQVDDVTVEVAVADAQPFLDRVVHTQITDASREADQVVITGSEVTALAPTPVREPITPTQRNPRVEVRQPAPRDEPALDPVDDPNFDPFARRRREQRLAEAKRRNRSPIGWIRMLTPPSCGRCAVLAGRWYGWNEGFQRHPNCDCRHIPALEDDGGDLTTDPKRYFDSLTEEEQNAYFGFAAAEAIRNGADIAQVINAQNREGGSYTVDGRQYTREGTTRRGYFGGTEAGRKKIRRPTPVQIYRDANGDRDEAIRLLTRFGYIVQ